MVTYGMHMHAFKNVQRILQLPVWVGVSVPEGYGNLVPGELEYAQGRVVLHD